jgi:hypothetical protein
MMEAVRTSETSVYSETTRRYIPQDSNLQHITRIYIRKVSRLVQENIKLN